MIAPDADGFSASRGYYTETIDGNVLYSPGIFVGVDYDTNSSGVGIDAFGSAMLSDAVNGSVVGANISYILPHAEDGIFRARIKGGVVHGTLDWEGDFTNPSFDDATGWQAGVGFDVGRIRRKISFYGELLYRHLEFDVEPRPGESEPTTTNRNTLDLSGGVINLGIKFTF